MAKMKIKKGDLVQVITGRSSDSDKVAARGLEAGDKGKQGRVLQVFPDTQRVLVEGINRRTPQASNFCFQRGFLFFQLGIFVCGFNQRKIGLLVADGVQAIAETFDFVFFDFFHVMASDKDKFIAPSMRDQVLCSQLMTL